MVPSVPGRSGRRPFAALAALVAVPTVARVVVAIVVTTLVACGSTSPSKRGASPPTTAAPVSSTATPSTTAPSTTTTAPDAPPSSLTVSGVGPGVNEAPFYPTVTVAAVSCGTAPGGRFLRVDLPAGAPGTPPGTALSVPTMLVVVAGKAVLRDLKGKVLYEETQPGLTVARQGGLVLSLADVEPADSDRRAVASGVVDVSGDYVCPATDVAFPGA